MSVHVFVYVAIPLSENKAKKGGDQKQSPALIKYNQTFTLLPHHLRGQM